MLSHTAEYALRAVVFLASHGDVPTNARQMAATIQVPPSYLAKVLQDLANAGIIHSRRGLGGGYTLAEPAENISVLTVINAVDPIRRIRTCPLGIPSHGTQLCPMHRRLDDAYALIEKSFADSTIAEIVNEESPSQPFCASV